ncbi:MAG: LexA family transcriptional regulator [Synergistaceae bacterium]|nr:LexA family transcriptional regulator [Synergistaceae bacterium]
MGISERIKVQRKRKGLSQATLGDLLGVSLKTVQRWELGERAPNSALMPRLASSLDTTSSYLMGETDSPSRDGGASTPAKDEARFADGEMEWVSVVTGDVKVCCGAGNVYPDEVVWEEIGKYPVPASALLGYAWQVGDGGFHIIGVEGDSMEPRVPAGSRILIADIRPINGDLAVALWRGRLILRGAFFERGRIRLRAWNKDYEDIVVRDDELDDLCFLGKMIGIVPPFDRCSSMV